ncbi:MAG TPA: ABC transporter ATP-binding protein [Propionibacteriaceae bacterium]|nr:ABC transporter ATP-binding protein [Propionibacteriaceae bacterium]
MTGVDLEEVSIRYSDVVAVDRLTLHASPGRVLGMLGGNGAGKSSTLRAIGGVNAHSSGRLTVAGFDLASPDGAEAARAVVGYCPDIGGLIAQATPDEHIDLLGSLRGRRGKRGVGDELVERFGLSAVRDRPAGTFSHGMQRRLSVLLAVLAAREALVLDEPFDGVDPSGVEVTVSAIRDAARSGMAVIVSTHLQQLLTSACDDVAVLVTGRLAALGPSDDFSGPEGERRYADLLRAGVVEAVA